jgi:hypothetical protein
MSFEEVRCLIPVCDNCDADWNEHDTIPHLSAINFRVAREILARDHGWTITEQPDGTHSMLCRSCSGGTGCDRGVHTWYEPELDFNAPVPASPIELCQHCGCVRRDQEPLQAPPAGHPESMTAELDDAAEEYLAELDAELSPEEAI